jgi:DNA processing protein
VAPLLTPAAAPAEENIYWLALRMVPGLGSRRAVPLIRQYQTPQAIFRAPADELVEAGLPGSIAQTIASGCTFEEAVDQQERLMRHQAELVPIADPRYPEALREIFDPPLLLFARGRLELLQKTSLAVVGTRRPSPYGVAATERLTAELAGAGMVITSGMARGIDTAAHRAALQAGGDTIAVFGSGLDHVYPAENRRLAEEIAAKGLLLSEYPMGTPGHPQNFPVRNRIISGLSIGVMVVEGAQYSGSAITATLAMEQGREVFAVPGNITSRMSWAPNLLIKQGAKLVQTAEDVLAELTPELRRRLREIEPAEEDGPALTPYARRLLEQVPVEEAVTLDALLDKVGDTSATELMSTLFELQLLGLVRQMPGRAYVRAWKQ